MAVIEHARNVVGLKEANSTEMEEDCTEPVISIMEEQKHIEDKGGTMRLGAWKCQIAKDSLAYNVYQSEAIEERHRHRYEVNLAYEDDLAKHGMVFSAKSPDGVLPEIVELDHHPWFIGVQFHPELKSKPFDPHPLFTSFISAAVDQSRLM